MNIEFAAAGTDKVGSVRIVGRREVVRSPKPGLKVNRTKDGIDVKTGQLWQDLDKRMLGRKLRVISVADGKAVMDGARKTTVSISRMHKSSTGWVLVES